MDCRRLFSVLYILFHIKGVENANILAILPKVEKSHYVMFKRLLEELARRGHNIDVLGGVPPSDGRSMQGMTFIEVPETKNFSVPNFTVKELRLFTVDYAVKFMIPIAATSFCKESFTMDVMKNLRDSKKKYDLLFLEIFVCDCLFGFAHIFKAPVVSVISSSDLPWGGYRIGNPDNPAYISVYFQGYRPHKYLNDKFWNTVSYLQAKIGHWWYLREQTKISREFFGMDMPDLNDIIANISLLLMNSHFTLNVARPMVPNFIEVGGLHIEAPREINTEIGKFIEHHKFIYFSLGSIADSESLEIEILRNIIHTFSEMQYKVLWKGNETEISKLVQLPPNILIHSWMPQLDILCHPNIVLFITHAGLSGIQEAIHCGVPMVCIPLFADQYQNCHNIVDRNVAKTLILESLTKDEFRSTVMEVIENPRYRMNAQIVSRQFKDRPMPPLETAVYWVEYVLRHKGASQLKSPSAGLKWYQYHLLDVFCLLLLSIILTLGACYILFRTILNRIRNILKIKTESDIKKKNS